MRVRCKITPTAFAPRTAPILLSMKLTCETLKAVSKRLIEFVSASSFGLVETLAERCCEIILIEFNVSQVNFKLSKIGAVRGAKAVGVILQRTRNNG